MGFLTIEDVNTNNLSLINEFYELDTSPLGLSDYINKMYDFCKVTRSTVSDTITFDFKIVNSLWTGGFYVTDSTGEYIDVSEDYTYDSTNNILSISVDDDIILHLYLCSFYKNTYTSLQVEQLSWCFNNLDIITDFEIDINLISFTSESINGCYITSYDYNPEGWDKSEFGFYANGGQLAFSTYSNNVLELCDDEGNNRIFLKMSILKTNRRLNPITSPIYLGIVNRVIVTTRDFQFNGVVEFNDNILPMHEISWNTFYFDLDLRDYNHNRVDFKIILRETTLYNYSEYDYSFNVDYKYISSSSEFVESITNEERIINLGADISLSDDIIVTSSVKITGNGNSIDLNSHSIILNSNVNFNVENLSLDNGDTAIIQCKNTKLELDNVTFTNCVSTDYNNQGACILCDIDINSLDSADDYITVLNNCTFVNNHNCIVHGGELTVTDCKYLNNDITYTDKNNVAFLYQVDGNANVNNSIFDINYNSDNYCVNEENIGFAQALLKMGETAQINGDSHKNYTDNISTFTNNNQCHLFVKYYYDKIESCVYSSPVIGKENKALCYSASGVNWIFKENIRVTRASSNNENNNQPFDWED